MDEDLELDEGKFTSVYYIHFLDINNAKSEAIASYSLPTTEFTFRALPKSRANAPDSLPNVREIFQVKIGGERP